MQIQSTQLERAVGRVVLPLVERRADSPANHPLTPHLMVLGKAVYANPFDLAAVPASRLGDALTTLAETEQKLVIRAVDELISRA